MNRNSKQDKQRLLDRLRKTPIVEVACKQVGVPRSTYYRWRKADEVFEAECDEAIEESAGLINDLAESQLINAIKNQNMSAIVFWLKHHHRNYATRVELSGNINHQTEVLTPEQAATVQRALQLAGLVEIPSEEASDEVTT